MGAHACTEICRPGNAKGFQVLIDHEVDYVDSHARRGVEKLDMDAVHGDISKLEQMHAEGSSSSMCHRGMRGSTEALRIVKNAAEMADSVADEEDMLDSQWHGVDGRNPLHQLFGTSNVTKIAEAIMELIEKMQLCCFEEPSLNVVPLPAKVYGDLHGQFRDMLLFLYHYGFPTQNGRCFVFNGDWVDRGAHQLEVICLVYALKLAFPDKVWLNRGNHEEIQQNIFMGQAGFQQHCITQLGKKLGSTVFNAFAESYRYLPFASLLGDNVFVVHGGIGDGDWDLDYLDEVERPIDDKTLEQDRVLYNMLWSDPIDEDQKDSFGVHDSPRDQHRHLMVRFGPDISQAFCERNQIGMIIRSHEAKMGGDGYEVMHGEKLARCFTARDYGDGGMANDGAIMSVRVFRGRVVVTPQVLKSVVKQRNRRE